MKISKDHSSLETLFREILSIVPVGITVIDATGRIVLCNPEAARIFGRNLIDVRIADLIPPMHREHHPAHMAAFIASGASRRMGQDKLICGLRADNTEIPIDVGLTSFHIERTHYIFASIIDVSHQKDIESRLEQSNQELSQFAHVASHDLIGPLRTIRSLVDLVEDDFVAGNHTEVSESVGRIRAIATKMDSLVSSILQRAKASHVGTSPSDANLKSVVDDVVEHCQGMSWMLGVSLEAEVRDCLLAVSPVLLYEVLENLVSNGLKYSNPNVDKKYVSITTRTEHASAVIEVIDNGVGIPEKNHGEVFTMYKRFHTEHAEGTGLGMAIVEKHVKQMQGTISFKSSPAGTCFTVVLPRLVDS